MLASENSEGASLKEPTVPEHHESRSVGLACDDFLRDARARLKPATVYKFELLLRRLQAFAKDSGIESIDRFGLGELRHFRESLRCGNVAAQKRVQEMRAFFGFCEDSDWISQNPAKKLQLPKVVAPPRQPFREEEIERIRASYSTYADHHGRDDRANANRLCAFVELLLHTGLRIGDAVRLRRDSIVDGKLRLRTEKTGTHVDCPLPETLLKRLREMKCTSTEYFFWTGKSKVKSAVGNWQRSLKRLLTLAGVSGHAHRFRHTFAKDFLMEGVPPERVAVLMGHSDSTIVLKHYSSWTQERQEQLEADVKRVWEAKHRGQVDIRPISHNAL
jgi:integrase